MAKKKKASKPPEEPKQHGGARPGAGRPKKANKKMGTAVKLSPDVLEFLRRDGAEPVSQQIEDAVRGTKLFKDWKKTQGDRT